MIALRCRLLTLVVVAQAALEQPRFDFDTTPGRLFKSVVPKHCTLTLALDPDAEHFSGQALLTLR